jgi:hypothetical protein
VRDPILPRSSRKSRGQFAAKSARPKKCFDF